ncbi:MAG: MBL fold metallo-hydrolase [Clostridiales bacterium]|nr:MBL fold metallo-hydrolase [Clostridiales bacterium]
MARFCSLFSSSSGNCTYIGGASGGILIDVGVSAKRTAAALLDIGVDICSIGAIFITHEHSDHVNGLRVFAGAHGIEVYTSGGTLQALEEKNILTEKYAVSVIPHSGVEACGMLVTPFSTSHDSKESVGYLVKTPDGRSIAIATDTGIVTDDTMQALLGCDMVMLESNHDVRMLESGPYPYFLKRRVLSNQGHLSNEVCADTAQALLGSGTTRFVLGHLSKQNNFPDLAYQATSSAFCKAGAQEGVDFILTVAGSAEGSRVIKF